MKVLGASTKEERDSYRKAAAQVRFLKGAYRLLWNTKYAGKTATNLGGNIDLFEVEVKKIEDELAPAIEKLLPSHRKKPPSVAEFSQPSISP